MIELNIPDRGIIQLQHLEHPLRPVASLHQ
jgi:hypothetical protein